MRSPDQHRRAPAERIRESLLVLGAGAIIGAVLITAATRYEPAFRTWLSQDLARRSRIVLVTLSVMIAGPALIAAGYCWQVASRQRRMMKAVAIALAAASVLLVFFLWRLFVLLEARLR